MFLFGARPRACLSLLTDNSLTGTVPASLTSLANMLWPALGGNNLCGMVPTTWCSLSSCDLSGNSFQCPSCESSDCGAECVAEWTAWSDCTTSCGGGTRTRNGSCAVETSACNTDECFQDCVGAWGQWSACSLSCGSGDRVRAFTIDSPSRFGGADCLAANGQFDLGTCNDVPCPTDCLGTWTPWSSCNATCGNSSSSKTFAVEMPAANGGLQCNVSDGAVQTRNCANEPCPVDCTGFWSAWETCPTTCGTNSHARTFSIYVASAAGGVECEFDPGSVETQACSTKACPVDCDGAWGSWSDCPVSCGGGGVVERTFVRYAAESDGGIACVASDGDVSTTLCATGDCPTDCVGTWAPWSACAETCGVGVTWRTFHVDIEASAGGKNCTAPDSALESATCATNSCPTDCSGSWSQWAQCDRTCGGGTQFRSFQIEVESAAGGSTCLFQNNSVENRTCGAANCPRDCVGGWSAWSECVPSCGSGRLQERTFVRAQAAANGGRECTLENDTISASHCASSQCPTDCVGEWGEWSACPQSCGSSDATARKTFYVLKEAEAGGAACALRNGTAIGRACNSSPCPSSCEGEWSAWSACSLTCGSGVRSRVFTVAAAASGGGTPCIADDGTHASMQCNTPPCPLDCVGAWGGWGACSASCGESVRARMFVAVLAAEHGGTECVSEVESASCGYAPCDLAATMDSATIAITVAGSVSGVVVLSVAIGVGVFCVLRKRQLRRTLAHTKHSPSGTPGHRVVAVSVGNDDADTDGIVANMTELLQSPDRSWSTIARLADLAESSLTWDICSPVVDEVRGVLAGSLDEQIIGLQSATSKQDADAIRLYSERVALLSASVARFVDNPADEAWEKVGSKLLLAKDRFSGESSAFLGRGASSAVSKGLLIQSVGVVEVRLAAAVKEVSKTGGDGEQRAMREFLLITEKLQPQHANVIRVLAVESSPSALFVVMELCHFGLDRQPAEFQDYLHGGRTDSGSQSSARVPVFEGHMVLNALVQDVLRGTAFLHSKHVYHCDIKPANILCAFDRGGKQRPFKSKYFQQAQLKLTDFGVSKIVRSERGTDGYWATATVSMAEFEQATGIAGTESYMSPEVLRVVQAIREGDAPENIELSAEALLRSDSFACGCVIGFLCSRGLHPFKSLKGGGGNIPKNIVAGNRVALRTMDILDQRHLELVEHLTEPRAEERWTVADCMTRSAVFASSAGGTHASEAATILLDTIKLRRRPNSACADQLLASDIVHMCPRIPDMVKLVQQKVRQLQADEASLPAQLDEDSYFAIAAYTMDNGVDRDSNVYYALNRALRYRKTHPGPFRLWQGFLFYLMRALDQLPVCEAVVYRGGNEGMDEDTAAREYTLGRTVQWAAFSSTSTSLDVTRSFVQKGKGVIFKISVLTGRDIGPYSFYPSESEILLSPNTKFAVSRALYTDELGCACVDLTEMRSTPMLAR
eukprot:INCI16332.2.p1 GENE.INCI16332.2~~INCI16332.2.p1  ORF type:complete len:1450 (-),score=213.01 INCI16332.2:215-4564(-)